MCADRVIKLPHDLEDLFKKLKYLSLLRYGFKLNLRNMNFDQSNSIIDNMFRSIFAQDRSKSSLFIKNIIDACLNAITRYQKTIFIELIIILLNDARIGINNLIDTYNDPRFQTDLMGPMTNIDIQLNTYKQYLNYTGIELQINSNNECIVENISSITNPTKRNKNYR